jgi:hypothetical protein
MRQRKECEFRPQIVRRASVHTKESMKNLYSILLNGDSKSCMAMEARHIIERRIKPLLDHSALVKIVSHDLSQNLELVAEERLLEVVNPGFHCDDLEGVFLTIAASHQAEVNKRKYLEASNERLENLRNIYLEAEGLLEEKVG